MARKTRSTRRKQPPRVPDNTKSTVIQDHGTTHPPDCQCFLRKQGLFLPPQLTTEEPKEEPKA